MEGLVGWLLVGLRLVSWLYRFDGGYFVHLPVRGMPPNRQSAPGDGVRGCGGPPGDGSV